MRTLMRVACGAGALLAVLMPALAVAKEKEETTIGVSLEASVLLGVGLSVGMPLGDRFNLRGAYHGFSYDDEFEDEGATYDAELELKTIKLLADWHPFRGVFRVTAGLASNGNQLNLTGQDDGTGVYEFGGCSFQSDMTDPLTVDGVVDFKSTAPYLGIGWGGNMNAEPGFYGTFDLGVLFSGAAKTRLDGRGTATNPPGSADQCTDGTSAQVQNYQEFQDALRRAEDDADEEAKDYKLWPNIAFGLGWRF